MSGPTMPEGPFVTGTGAPMAPFVISDTDALRERMRLNEDGTLRTWDHLFDSEQRATIARVLHEDAVRRGEDRTKADLQMRLARACYRLGEEAAAWDKEGDEWDGYGGGLQRDACRARAAGIDRFISRDLNAPSARARLDILARALFRAAEPVLISEHEAADWDDERVTEEVRDLYREQARPVLAEMDGCGEPEMERVRRLAR